MAEQDKPSAADSKTAGQEPNSDVKNSDVKLAKRPAITTYDARLIRQRPHLFPPEIIRDRDFRRMVLRDNFPLPADDYREGYHVGSDASYWLNGLECYLKTLNVIEKYELEISDMLDFGCASGRVTRHFRCQMDDVQVWAADINPKHIDWLSAHFPRNPKAIAVNETPGIAIADNSLDFISAYSVFTHIDETETGWLAEMRRVLRPGGMAYFTVHNEDTWRAMSDLDPANRLVASMLRREGFTLERLQQPMPVGKTAYYFADEGAYRAQVFHSNCYLKEVWSQFFTIHEILPCEQQRQSVVIMTK